MQHIELPPGNLDLVTLDHPAIRSDRLDVRNSELNRLIGDPFDERPVRLMRPLDRNVECFRQVRRSADMINMAMGEHDFLDIDAVLADCLLDTRNIPARVAMVVPAATETKVPGPPARWA